MTSAAFAGCSQAASSEEACADLNRVVVRAENAIVEAVGPTVSLTFALSPSVKRVAVSADNIRSVIVALCEAACASGEVARLVLETRGVNDAPIDPAAPLRTGEPRCCLVVRRAQDARTREEICASSDALKSWLERLGVRLEVLVDIHGDVAYVAHLPYGAPAQASGRMAVAPVVGEGLILLIEDEPQVQAVTVRILRAFGYSVITAHNEQTALAQAERHGDAIALVISDLVLPGVSGTDLVRSLQQPCGQARVLYVSGYSPEHIGEPLGEASFLRKPFTADELLANVRELLPAAVH